MTFSCSINRGQAGLWRGGQYISRTRPDPESRLLSPEHPERKEEAGQKRQHEAGKVRQHFTEETQAVGDTYWTLTASWRETNVYSLDFISLEGHHAVSTLSRIGLELLVDPAIHRLQRLFLNQARGGMKLAQRAGNR